MKNTVEIVFESGSAAWPEVHFGVEAVAQSLSAKTSAQELMHPADLYLALACAAGIPAALSIFERHLLSEVAAFVARINPSPAFADEVRQRLRERLLVGPSARIAEYRGNGPLGAWLRVASVRIAIDLLRADGATRATPIHDVATRALDPEFGYIAATHRPMLEDALRKAVTNLTTRERNVLRMYFVNGWTFARIGRSYRVHRGTVTRWVADIRQRLLDQMLAELGDKLSLSINQLRSLAGLLGSQVDAGLSGLGKELSD
jgi:RNA polymerase sigma-70 factor (ECF subfamily)